MESSPVGRVAGALRADAATRRLVLGGLVLALLAPGAVGAATHAVAAATDGAVDPDGVTFVSTQGTSTRTGAGVYAVDTDSERVVWSYTACPEKCFDVDPLTDETVLFVAKTKPGRPWNVTNASAYNWHAIHLNWRTGEVIARFPVPIETHDVDYLGEGRYVVANKVTHDGAEATWVAEAKRRGWIDERRSTHSHLVYVYDRDRDEIVWEYRFADHFPRDAGDGYDADYTHLNDVDPVRNGSAFLLSPREFDRVLLIDRETKATVWTLGAEDEYDVLHEQHNPTLLATDPPTVLVADSENDRVIEYRRTADGGWERTWLYARGLDWPRDADRLPSGNTLIADSGNDRVLEVTPAGEVVWEFPIERAPYDVERVRHGDEPRGPPSHTIEGARSVRGTGDEPSAPARAFAAYHGLAAWVVPPGVGPGAFVALHGALVVGVVWAREEWRAWSNSPSDE
jgi:hypothetical protein